MPKRWSRIYQNTILAKNKYKKLFCEHTKKFAALQEFVVKNKKCPNFKEDFEKIKKDPNLFFLYRSLNAKRMKMEKSHCIRNEIFINKIKKPEFQKLGIPNIQILFDFLDAALKYQEENLIWFTNSEWFNKNSQLIFENLEKIHTIGTDENKYFKETTNIIIDEDDDKEIFNNYVKPYKSLRYFSKLFFRCINFN